MADRLAEIQELPKEAWGAYLAALSETEKAELLATLKTMDNQAKYAYDPVRFVNEKLGESLWSKQREIAEAVRDHTRVIIPSCHAGGKAATLDTPIPTPSGWTTMGEVGVGDFVYDEQGKPTEVVGISPVHRRPCYRVVFDDRSEVVVSDEHIWRVLEARPRATLRQNLRNQDGSYVTDWRDHWVISRDLTTQDMVDTGVTTKDSGRRFAIPTTRPIAGTSVDLPVPPYTLGIWLGDGTSQNPSTTSSLEDAPIVLANIEGEGVATRARPSAMKERQGGWGLLGIKNGFRDANLLDNKHIPKAYFRASIEDRLSLIQGLVDSDGYLANGESYEITLTRLRLAEDTAELLRTMGWKVYWSEGRATLNGVDCGPKYRIRFWPDRIVARLPRKQPKSASPQSGRKSIRMVVDIQPVGEQDVKCIAVDSPSNLYLISENLIPTHNTHLAARLVVWWIMSWPVGSAEVITTATNFRQVQKLLWPNIRRLHERHGLPGKTNQVDWQIGNDPVAWGFSAADSSPESVQGVHKPHLLIIVDEAAGIGHSLGQAFESLLTGGAHILLIGNPPTDNEGTWFEDCCNSPRWYNIRLSAFDTPNWTGEETDQCTSCPAGSDPHNISTHLVDKKWAQDLADDYGEDSPMYLAKVKAEFPRGVASKTVPYGWVEAALDNKSPWGGIGVQLGVDVASDGGDEVVIARSIGHTVEIVYSNAGNTNADAVDVAGEILVHIDEAEKEAERLGSTDRVKVKIDAIGLGWGVASVLDNWGREGRHNAEIVQIKVSEQADEPDKFVNQRAEMWWNVRLLCAPKKDEDTGLTLTPQLSLDMDRKSAAQLTIPNYKSDTKGRIQIESKQSMKARGQNSPDRAEAICLAVYNPQGKKKRKARLIL